MVLDFTHIDFFSLSNSSRFAKNVIIFGVDNSTTKYADNSNKDISVFAEDIANELDDTAITAEAEYSNNFLSNKKSFA